MATCLCRPAQEYSRFNFEHATPRCCTSTSSMPRTSAARCSRRARRMAATNWRCRPMTSASSLPTPQPVRCAGRHLRHRAAGLYPCACANSPRAAARPGARRRAAALPERRRGLFRNPAINLQGSSHVRTFRSSPRSHRFPSRWRPARITGGRASRPSPAPALLRRLPQGHGLCAHEVDGGSLRPQVLLRLQAFQVLPPATARTRNRKCACVLSCRAERKGPNEAG